MKSLYDVLGVRADDDAQAIKRAFRAAVKEHHPDLHPGDPDAALRFRRIVTANAILRDEKQRAAYDQLLAVERQRLETKTAHQQLQLRQQRRQGWLKMGGVAAVALGAIFGALAAFYGLFTHADATATKFRPAGAQPAVSIVTVTKDKVAVSTTSASMTSGSIGNAGTAVQVVDTDGSPMVIPENADNPPAEKKDDAGGVIAEAPASARSDDTPGPDAAPSAADKGEAVALADRHQPTAPRHEVGFYRELGSVSYRIGDFPRAIVNFDLAISRDPRDAKSYHLRGNAWDEMGASGKAAADYDEAIRLDPKNAAYFHDRAIMWHRRGEFDKALADLDRAVRLGPSDPNIYCDRGLVWYEKGNRTRAIADFSQAARLDPGFAAYIIRGLIRHRSSEFNVAFADIGKTIRVQPSVIDAARKAR